jgi:hypothetical protein
VEDIGGSGGIHFRFFAKKKRRFILCFRDFSRLLAGFRSRFSVGFSERFSSAAGITLFMPGIATGQSVHLDGSEITLFMPGMRRRAIHVTRGPLFQGLFSTFGRFETWMTYRCRPSKWCFPNKCISPISGPNENST